MRLNTNYCTIASLIYVSAYFFAHYVILSKAKNLSFFTSEYVPALGGDNEFPGDYTGGETPDPIPNSEAKPVQADGSPLGESRSSPGIIKAEC